MESQKPFTNIEIFKTERIREIKDNVEELVSNLLSGEATVKWLETNYKFLSFKLSSENKNLEYISSSLTIYEALKNSPFLRENNYNVEIDYHIMSAPFIKITKNDTV